MEISRSGKLNGEEENETFSPNKSEETSEFGGYDSLAYRHRYTNWEVGDYVVYQHLLGSPVLQIVDAPYLNSYKEFKLKLKDVADYGVHGDYGDLTIAEYACKEFILLCKEELGNPTKFVNNNTLLQNNLNNMVVLTTGEYLPKGDKEDLLPSFGAKVIKNPLEVYGFTEGETVMLVMKEEWYLVKPDYSAT